MPQPDVEAVVVVVVVLLTGIKKSSETSEAGTISMNHTLVLPHCLNIILY